MVDKMVLGELDGAKSAKNRSPRDASKSSSVKPQASPNPAAEEAKVPDVNELVKERLKKLEDLKGLSINAYPYRFDRTHSSAQILKQFKDATDQHSKESVSTAGRIMALRRMGKISFAHLQDHHGKIQAFFSEGELKNFDLLKKFDIGDFIGVQGPVFKTKAGEITVFAKKFEMLAKAIRPLPEKYHGLKDTELRYRKRYLDLVMNPDVKDVFVKRTVIMDTFRSVLNKDGYLEVDTPVLSTMYGGANARPFSSHLHALNTKVYMRISPELFLKRLIVGGFDKVFEFSKDFRNEGIDKSHNPEFTIMEAYMAYGDLTDMMDLVEDTLSACAKALHGSTTATFGNHVIEFKKPFARMTMEEAIKIHANVDVTKLPDRELFDLRTTYNIEIKGDITRGIMIQQLFEELVEDKLIQPTMIIEHPQESTPLAKISRKDPSKVERFELFIAGMEIANAYSELNDPIRQRFLLEEQAKQLRGGNEEAHPMDEDFVEAMEYGMPPTGGIGIGIDRVAMIMLNQPSIRDVILFPFMKPLE